MVMQTIETSTSKYKENIFNCFKKDQESGGAVSVRKDDLIIKLQ